MIKLCLALALALPSFAKEKKAMQWHGQTSGVQSPEHRLIETPEAWESAWKEIGKKAPASPDFAKQFAVAVFVGPKPTGGYSVAWETPKREGQSLVVRFSVKEPKGMIVTQAFTQPWDIRVFDRAGAADVVVEGRP